MIVWHFLISFILNDCCLKDDYFTTKKKKEIIKYEYITIAVCRLDIYFSLFSVPKADKTIRDGE